MIRRAPGSTLFPYTTRFRSRLDVGVEARSRRLIAQVDAAQVVAADPAELIAAEAKQGAAVDHAAVDRKSTRLNSSHANISYAVFCLHKKAEYPSSTLHS